MTKIEDREFEVKTVTAVKTHDDGFTITTNGGWCFYVPNKNVTPVVGSKATFYGKGFGSIVRGLDIDGVEVFYRTPEQQKVHHEQEIAERDAKKQRDLDANREARDARWSKLPIEFVNRLTRFAEHNPLFRRDFEPYELMVCEQAVAMAAKFPSRDELDAFHKMDWEEQKKAFPELDEGHSGNSFGCAVFLAAMFLESPELVEKAHGAMCPLVGCKEYGCYASYAKAA